MTAPSPIDLLLPTSVMLFARGAVLLFEQSGGRDTRRTTGSPETDELLPCPCRPAMSASTQAAPHQIIGPSRPTILMTQPAYSRVLRDLLRVTPEAGGALIGPRDCELITHYVPNAGESTTTSFTLDHETLNRQLAVCRGAGLDLKGIVHSHPAGVHSPSSGDRLYLERLLGNPKNREATVFAFPIVCDGRLWPYVAVRVSADEIGIREANLTLV